MLARAGIVVLLVAALGLGETAGGVAPLAVGTGEMIVFESKRDGPGGAIYLMFGDGSAQKRLAIAGEGTTPAWSPSGTRIAYGRIGLHIAEANGLSTRALTTHAPGSFTGDYQPAWSPDGTRIAFTRSERGNNDIYVIGVDGNGLTRLTTNPLTDYMPVWSPDGAKIAFASGYADGTFLGNMEIAVMNADGSGQQRLTSSPDFDIAPDWSPDGSRIAFAAYRHRACCSSEIYTMTPAGGDQRRITTEAAGDWLPDWSPDGTRIAFASFRDGNQEIYVMSADGSGPTNISRSPSDDAYPDWTHTADLSVRQSSRPRKVRVGQALTYTISVRNAGPGAVTDVTVRDVWPARARVVSLSAAGGTCARSRGTCSFAAIRSGATVSLRLRLRPTRAGAFVNRISVLASRIDPELSNNNSALRTRILPKKRRR